MGDSLLTDKTNKILINNFRLFNINNRNLQMGVELDIPNDWRLLGDSNARKQLFLLRPIDTVIIPLNLVRLRYKNPGWDRVTIKVFNRQIQDSQTYYYYIGTAADSSVAVSIDQSPISVDGLKEVKLPLYVKNTGNVLQEITAVWYSDDLKIKESSRFSLQPGQDTAFRKVLSFAGAAFNKSQNQNVNLKVFGNKKVFQNEWYTLSKSRSEIKSHASAYNCLPVRLFAGFLNSGDNYSFYGGINGSWVLDNNTDVQFSYQTKQIGNLPGNDFQQNPFSLKIRHKRWTATAGQAIVPTGFQVVGQGLGLTYTLPDKSYFGVQAVIHSNNPFYKSDNYSAVASYRTGNRTSLEHQAIYNNDIYNKVNSYLLNNQFTYSIEKLLEVKISGNVGKQQYTSAIARSNSNWGVGGGYSLIYKPSIFSITSSVVYNSGSMPGYFNGLTSHNHGIGVTLGKKTFTLFYTNSKFTQNIYRDSFFNSDVFSYNVEQYGLNISSQINDQLDISTSLGRMKGQALFQGMSSFYSVDGNLNWRKKSNTLSLNIRNGIGKNPNGGTAYANSSTVSVRTKFAFASINYNYFPADGGEESSRGTTETVNSSFGTNFGLFHQRLNIGLYGNMFKTLYEKKVNYGVGGNINYRGKSDLMVNLSGNIPLSNIEGSVVPVANQKSIMLTISKTLNLPLLYKRNYHDMKVVLYHDINNNGIKDINDTVIRKATLAVKSQNMVTDKKGAAHLKNISSGKYELSFINTNTYKLIPSNGPIQYAEAKSKNLTVEIPFKIGKQLNGNIRIIRDSFSRVSFTPDGIKVILIDEHGNTYNALTDEKGNFSFSLPAGKYNISLNAKTFENSDFKPKVASFEVDLSEKDEQFVQFEIQQKKRKVRNVSFD